MLLLTPPVCDAFGTSSLRGGCLRWLFTLPLVSTRPRAKVFLLDGWHPTRQRFWSTVPPGTVRLIWCPVYDSNARPTAYKAAALPTELTGLILLVRRPVRQRHSFFSVLYATRHGSHLQPRRFPAGVPCISGVILSAFVLARWQRLHRTWHFASSSFLRFSAQDHTLWVTFFVRSM